MQKKLARIPLAQTPADFHAFAQAGRDLANLHLNYETAPEHPDIQEIRTAGIPHSDIVGARMTFGKNKDKTTIHYNPTLALTNIPLAAYDYQVNGRSPIEWVMKYMTVRQDTGMRGRVGSGIVNDANQYSDNPRHIISLIKRLATISIATQKIVKNLPALKL